MNSTSLSHQVARFRVAVQRTLRWLIKKRIPFSIFTFTFLIVLDLLVLDREPLDPSHIRDPLAVLSCLLIVIGLGIRSWAAGTLRKSEELITSGPYSICRNPLYVGSFLMMFGFCVLLQNWYALGFVSTVMAFVYWIQIRAEERNLERWFPRDWESYRNETNRLIPLIRLKKLGVGWSVQQWRKNREYQAIFASAIGIVGVFLLHHGLGIH